MRDLNRQTASTQQMQGGDQGERVDVQGTRTLGLCLHFSAMV